MDHSVAGLFRFAAFAATPIALDTLAESRGAARILRAESGDDRDLCREAYGVGFGADRSGVSGRQELRDHDGSSPLPASPLGVRSLADSSTTVAQLQGAQ